MTQLLAICSCILRGFVGVPGFVFKLLIGICAAARGISVIVAQDCARHGCSQLGDLPTRTAKALVMRGDFVFSKTLNSPVDHLLTVRVQSVCQVFMVSSPRVYFPTDCRAHPSLVEGYFSVSRLLARWRGYRRDELTVQPLCYKKNPRRDACCMQREDDVPA